MLEAGWAFFSAEDSRECVGRRAEGGSRGAAWRTVCCQLKSSPSSSSSLSVETARGGNLKESCVCSGRFCGATRIIK